MARILFTALLAALLVPVAGYAAADAKLLNSCADCHGEKGVSTAQDVPTLAGVSTPVHTDGLKAYRAKTAPCPKVNYKRGDTKRQGDMCTAAKSLSDAEIADLADYYSKQAFVPLKQPFDAAKAATGKTLHDRDCKKCHTAGGKDPADDAGILAGQPLGWLKSSLASFHKGEKEQPKKMKDVISKLGDPELEALANFYASEQ
jgi:cytochrome subunit of sulfide dehydrogenase